LNFNSRYFVLKVETVHLQVSSESKSPSRRHSSIISSSLTSAMNINDNTNAIDLQLEDVEDYSADYPPSDGGYPNAEANMAPAGNSEEGMSKSPSYRRDAIISLVRNNKWAFAVFGVVFIVLIGIIAASAGSKKPKTYSNASFGKGKYYDDFDVGVPPVEMHLSSVDPDVLSSFKFTLKSAYDRHNIDKNLLDEMTPQRQAMIWMAQNKNVNALEHTEKLQRFVLAVLFYSTNMIPSVHVEDPKAWKVADNWMSDADSCDWMGVECNEDNSIIAIYLEQNRLSGKIPVDIALISNKMQTLDFTDNVMHMRDDDFDAFLSLSNLKTFLMDDNYLFHDKGLPPQFAALSNLEKMRLSYNVFEGELDSEAPVLASMTKLTHLEMESNYFNGTMPSAIEKMDQLTYLYMRRNNMAFNLDFMKTGQFDNMFAMWLDGNFVSGTIPTEIGLMSSLASFSVANATLRGTIPYEIGNLNQLRRLWLFGNNLSGNIPQALNELQLLEVVELHGNNLVGNMPEGVCASVRNSEYAYKSLTSDCASAVTCGKSCCTQCY